MEKRMNDNQTKAYQRADNTDRSKPYKDWRRTLRKGLYCLDVDMIEWRFRNGELVPVAVFEITMNDNGGPIHNRYLNAILDRFEQRDMQAQAARHIAAALNVNAYIVLYRHDCTEFFLYNLSSRRGWYRLAPHVMAAFINSL